MEKQKFSILTWAKLIFFIVLYFYLFIYSAYTAWHGIKNGQDVMNPLIGIVFCLTIAGYAFAGKKGQKALNKKVSPWVIAGVILLFFIVVASILWYAKATS